MTLGTLLLIVLVVILLGGLRDWGPGPFYGTGHWGGGGLSLAVVVLLILLLTGRL